MHISFLDLSSAFGLSIASGLSPFSPLALIALLAKLGLVTLSPSFSGLSSDLVLWPLVGLAVAEFVAGKNPGFDRVLHRALLPVSVTGGAVLFAAHTGTVQHVHPAANVFLSLLAGGATAGAVHTARTVMRSPVRLIPGLGKVVSFVEMGTALLLASTAVFAPGLTVVILVVLGAAAALVGVFAVRATLRFVGVLYEWIRRQRGAVPAPVPATRMIGVDSPYGDAAPIRPRALPMSSAGPVEDWPELDL
jgi:hypothetical protein